MLNPTYHAYIQVLQTGNLGSVEECSAVPASLWADVKFATNHIFNYFEMSLDIMDDKPITPLLDNIYQLFAQDALDVIAKIKVRPTKNTRLILELLGEIMHRCSRVL